jgi:hypothetical protein
VMLFICDIGFIVANIEERFGAEESSSTATLLSLVAVVAVSTLPALVWVDARCRGVVARIHRAATATEWWGVARAGVRRQALVASPLGAPGDVICVLVRQRAEWTGAE